MERAARKPQRTERTLQMQRTILKVQPLETETQQPILKIKHQKHQQARQRPSLATSSPQRTIPRRRRCKITDRLWTSKNSSKRRKRVRIRLINQHLQRAQIKASKTKPKLLKNPSLNLRSKRVTLRPPRSHKWNQVAIPLGQKLQSRKIRRARVNKHPHPRKQMNLVSLRKNHKLRPNQLLSHRLLRIKRRRSKQNRVTKYRDQTKLQAITQAHQTKPTPQKRYLYQTTLKKTKVRMLRKTILLRTQRRTYLRATVQPIHRNNRWKTLPRKSATEQIRGRKIKPLRFLR